MTHKDYREALVDLLISVGTNGIKQSQITARLQRYADSEQLGEYLFVLWKAKRVQRYTLPPKKKGGRQTTIWRATELICN